MRNIKQMCPVTVNGAAESSPSRARTHTSHPRILSFPHPTSLLPSSPPLTWRDSSRSSSVVRQHSLFTLQNLTIKQLPSKSHSKPLKVSLQLLKKPSPLIKVQVTHNQYPPALSHRLLSAPKTLNTNIPQTKISQCLPTQSQCMI